MKSHSHFFAGILNKTPAYSEGVVIQLQTDQTCSASLFEINPSLLVPQQVPGDAIYISTPKVNP